MPKVIWYFRKQRDLGNFSIENSFRELLPYFKDTSWEVEWREASWFSQGLLNRIRIAWEARNLQADIIHITGDIHFAALLLGHRRALLTIHDNGYLNEHRGVKRWVMKMLWLTYPLRQCTRVVAVSQATKADILKHTNYPPSQIEVIPTCIPSHFRPRTALPQNPKPVLLHIGLAANKNLRGHALAIKGMNVRLRIIGEPSAADHAMLRELHLDYEWLTRLTDEQMQEAYADADVLLFCSTAEGFGMPILEAMSVGLPVITSNIEPMNDVGAGYAHLVDPNNPSEIREKIHSVLALSAVLPKAKIPTDASLRAASYGEVYKSLMA